MREGLPAAELDPSSGATGAPTTESDRVARAAGAPLPCPVLPSPVLPCLELDDGGRRRFMLADWGLDDSRSWRPGYLRPGERAGEIQVSARGKGRRSGGRSAGKGGKGERAREIEGGSARGRSRRARGGKGGDPGERARHRATQWRERAGEIQASSRAIGARGRRRMGSRCRALDAGRFFPTAFS